VAVESTVTVPFGERVNCVIPLAVGNARIFTVSVAFLQKSEVLDAVPINPWT
jgi:hypothetical protein